MIAQSLQPGPDGSPTPLAALRLERVACEGIAADPRSCDGGSPPMRRPFPLALLGALALLSASCRSTNLDERPDWATYGNVPDPLVDPGSVVVFGAGEANSVKDARDKAEADAYRRLASMIESKVVSTAVHDVAMRAGLGPDDSRLTDSFQSLTQVSARQVIVGLREVLSWKGYDEEVRFHYGIYKLDRTVAADRAADMARDSLAKLEGYVRLLDTATAPEERGRHAEAGLLEARRATVAGYQCQFFDRKVPAILAVPQLEVRCRQGLIAAAAELRETGVESRLEVALGMMLALYQNESSHIVREELIQLCRRLPCPACIRTGKCVACKGVGHFEKTCPKCMGSKFVETNCTGCDGDGRALCDRCQGKGMVEVACAACKNGEQPCTQCRGGKVEAECPTCSGKGQIPCPRCGNDFRSIFRGRGKGCKQCNNKGLVPCNTCGGRGRAMVNCSVCGGDGRAPCSVCKGSRVVSQKCQACTGDGRRGVCQVCGGKKRVVKPCLNCTDGIAKEPCKLCNSTGNCPACGGVGHRTLSLDGAPAE